MKIEKIILCPTLLHSYIHLNVCVYTLIMVVLIDETFENFVHSITTFHTFNCKTLRYVVYAKTILFLLSYVEIRLL